ncbi:hypothetical protein QL995_21355 [Pseudoalteromonas sp. APC 3358]|uniref:Glutaredoxin domain-containing protein n=1 Tax=Brumicola blandensis TaxID=3075611 RepID=A0AAW8R0D9_9ALTE|nr:MULTISPECIES: glutaredoxin domain-containing protein [Alteromonadales]MDN3385172.1 hypothetical protein [Pseudoalteromonas sp. APC 3358]MDT0581545.1 hypothetical protein [Alteromonas sp. W409]
MPNIEIYTKGHCPFSKEAKETLNNHHIGDGADFHEAKWFVR